MEENKIPTADDFMNFDYLESNGVDFPSYESIKKQMIEFAKMHVKKYNEIYGKIEVKKPYSNFNLPDKFEIDLTPCLTEYLTNIK